MSTDESLPPTGARHGLSRALWEADPDESFAAILERVEWATCERCQSTYCLAFESCPSCGGAVASATSGGTSE